ncbi:MAG: hypothetical protein M1151_06465 [Candidatus Thermoplasmatota archaeon]|nr:hypothetical protein [Candidatus Thermoplasmatota archaeon]MCL5786291.1 hypothetical protein [Candidatus Thermoplasmatota archaeon]
MATTRSQAPGAKLVAMIALILQIVFLVLEVIAETDKSFNTGLGSFSGMLYSSQLAFFLVAVILMVVFIIVNYILVITPLQQQKYKGTDLLCIVLGIVELILVTVAPALLVPGILLVIVGILLLM